MVSLFLASLRYSSAPSVQHLLDAQDLRAVRIFGGFTLGVVLAVNRRPLLGDHAGRHPQPEAEEMTRKRMQFQGAVRLVTMQKMVTAAIVMWVIASATTT
jgi:hypothetical protein